MRSLLLTAALCGLVLAQTPGPSIRRATYENSPALVLFNDKLEVTVAEVGATFASLALRDDPGAPNPLWEPLRMARELGRTQPFTGSAGHFVCVDGFGPASPEERAAGLPMHGEAHTLHFESHADRQANVSLLVLEATLPLVQEKFTRTLRLADNENVVMVESRLENLMAFDRPVNWAEHATIGSPFLESGSTVVDVSGSRSMTRPYTEARQGASQRRIASGKEFTWPMAPGLDEAGAAVDLRQTPAEPHYLDHAATLVDPERAWGWVTALNTRTHLILGYLFRRADFPWVQHWGNYPPTAKMSRGLEFSTQPFDVSRRQAIDTHSMFSTPAYRWLPAKSAIEAKFLMFYAHAPEGMTRVDEVRLADGALVIEDRAAGKTLRLAASLGL